MARSLGSQACWGSQDQGMALLIFISSPTSRQDTQLQIHFPLPPLFLPLLPLEEHGRKRENKLSFSTPRLSENSNNSKNHLL